MPSRGRRGSEQFCLGGRGLDICHGRTQTVLPVRVCSERRDECCLLRRVPGGRSRAVGAFRRRRPLTPRRARPTADHRAHRIRGQPPHPQRNAAGAHLHPGRRSLQSKTACGATSRRLWNTQYFEDIRLEVQDSPNRPNAKIVIFHVVERPIIRRIEYHGNQVHHRIGHPGRVQGSQGGPVGRRPVRSHQDQESRGGASRIWRPRTGTNSRWSSRPTKKFPPPTP